MDILLSQVYHSRHPKSALQRTFDQPFALPASLGNRKQRQYLRRMIRLVNAA